MMLPGDGKERSELVYDHRVKNARPIKERFEEFYLELDEMLEEFGKAAEERRASMFAHLPFAVSVPALIEKVSRKSCRLFSYTWGVFLDRHFLE